VIASERIRGSTEIEDWAIRYLKGANSRTGLKKDGDDEKCGLESRHLGRGP